MGASVEVVLRHHAASRMGRELQHLRATTQADAVDRGRSAQLTGDFDWHRAHLRIAATETTSRGSDLAKLEYLLEHPELPSHKDDLPSRMFSAAIALAQAHGRQVTLFAALATPALSGVR
ncbi:MAG: hypothetical protein QOD93_5113 [Acetobacteraceae bacterium]|jgi:hypothetical protein|nr:hypothetical protein [Acetobacteraceae bacterium]